MLSVSWSRSRQEGQEARLVALLTPVLRPDPEPSLSGPVVKTLRFHHRGHRFDPLLGKLTVCTSLAKKYKDPISQALPYFLGSLRASSSGLFFVFVFVFNDLHQASFQGNCGHCYTHEEIQNKTFSDITDQRPFRGKNP